MSEHTTILPSGGTSSGESMFPVLDELSTALQQALSLTILISVDSDTEPRHADAAVITCDLLKRARGLVEQLLADDRRGRPATVEPAPTSDSASASDDPKRDILLKASAELCDWLHHVRAKVVEPGDGSGSFEAIAPVMFDRMIQLNNVLACSLDDPSMRTEEVAAIVNREKVVGHG